MSVLCEVCDRSIVENSSEYLKYFDILWKKNDKKYTISNFNLDEFDK